MNLNKAFVLGNLTRDPERKMLPSGQPVCNFGIATNRFYTSNDGQKQQEAEFHNIVAFGKLAETASQYLKKGSMVLIEGRIRTRNWDDTSGIKHYKTEIVAERLQLGPRPAGAPSFQRDIPETPPARENITQEEIPVIEEGVQEPPAQPIPTNKPAVDFPEDIGEEIDVKDIPF